jgi:hypothetical protein
VKAYHDGGGALTPKSQTPEQVARGHLRLPGLGERRRRIPDNHTCEFEADAFAFKRLAAKMDPRAAGIAAVTFFRFLDLMEHIAHGAPHPSETHPAARDRWKRLRRSRGLKDKDNEHVGLIESMFDMALKVQPDFVTL